MCFSLSPLTPCSCMPRSCFIGKKREMYEHPVFCLASQVMDLTIREYPPYTESLHHFRHPFHSQAYSQRLFLYNVISPVFSACLLFTLNVLLLCVQFDRYFFALWSDCSLFRCVRLLLSMFSDFSLFYLNAFLLCFCLSHFSRLCLLSMCPRWLVRSEFLQ